MISGERNAMKKGSYQRPIERRDRWRKAKIRCSGKVSAGRTRDLRHTPRDLVHMTASTKALMWSLEYLRKSKKTGAEGLEEWEELRSSWIQLSDRDWVVDKFTGHGKDCGFYSKGVTGSPEPGNLAYVVKIPMSMENCLWILEQGQSHEAASAKPRRRQWPGPGSQQVTKSKWSWHMF